MQAQAFDPVMQGKDLIVRSKTGTGKTAAFGLPLLEKMDPEDKAVRALVLCPTRELALQVAAELSDLGKYKGIRVTAIYGGASMKEQEDALEAGSPIVVGTPGRVFDHIRRKNLKLGGCRHAVLDEADEMLNQGFYEEVTRILDQLPKDRQVLLFSATVPPEIQNIIRQYTTSPEMLMLSGDVLTVDHIHHVRYDVSDDYPKPRNLIYVLEMEEPDTSIVFCNTRDDTALVTAVLNRNGFDAELLNGDLPQKERERVMAKVKRGEVAFMVATDIAARGIDISDLGHVINYSLPEDPAVYLHRVGRTGRIGEERHGAELISGPGAGHAHHPGEEVRHRLRDPTDAVAGGSFADVDRAPRPGHPEIRVGQRLRGLPGPGRFTEAASRRRRQHRLPPQVLLRPPPDGQGPGRRRGGRRGPEGRATSAGTGPGALPGRPTAPRRADRAEPGTTGAAGAAATARPPRRGRGPAGRRRSLPVLPRPSAEPAAPGQVRMWLNLGTADGLDAAGLGTALEALGAPAGKVQRSDLRPTYAYLFVAEEDAPAFESLTGKTHGSKTLKLERARRR